MAEEAQSILGGSLAQAEAYVDEYMPHVYLPTAVQKRASPTTEPDEIDLDVKTPPSSKSIKRKKTEKRILSFDFADKECWQDSTDTPDSPEQQGIWSFHDMTALEHHIMDRALVHYCAAVDVRLGTCKSFMRPYIGASVRAVLYLNKKFGTMLRQIPFLLHLAIADFLWPSKQNFIYNHTSIGGMEFCMVTAGWCDNEDRVPKVPCHTSYLVDVPVMECDRRIPAEVFVLCDRRHTGDHIFRDTSVARNIWMPISQSYMSITHITAGQNTARFLGHQMTMAIWMYGGIHDEGSFPVSLELFSDSDIDSSIQKEPGV